MRSAILAFTAGAAWIQMQPTLPTPAALVACAVAAVVVGLLLRRSGRPLAASFLSGLLLGICWAALLAHLALNHALPRADEGRDIAVTGVVASLAHRFAGGVRFQFDVAHVDTPGATVPPTIILSWYGAIATNPSRVHPGERWRLVVRLQRPHGNVMWNACSKACSNASEPLFVKSLNIKQFKFCSQGDKTQGRIRNTRYNLCSQQH